MQNSTPQSNNFPPSEIDHNDSALKDDVKNNKTVNNKTKNAPCIKGIDLDVELKS